MSWGWGNHRIRKLISFPSKVLWSPTSLKSHQRGPRTVIMRATRMISSVPPHTHRQYLSIPFWWPFPASSSRILYISVWVPPWHLCLNSCSSGWTGWAWRYCPCLRQRVWTMGSLSSLPHKSFCDCWSFHMTHCASDTMNVTQSQLETPQINGV